MLPLEPRDNQEPAQLLKEGIQAAKNGQLIQARTLLMQVIALDENNEQAWLWLSGVVETDEDRLVCLENVLALNPDQPQARKGLDRLKNARQPADSPTSTLEVHKPRDEDIEYVVRKEHLPVSAAAAVLYPERQVKEWSWKDNAELLHIPEVTYGAATAYDDICEKEVDICAYCAQVVQYDETQCSKCKRKLITSRFRYPKASADLFIFFTLLVGTSQLFFIQLLMDLITSAHSLTMVYHLALFLILFALAMVIFFRQFWAYTASILILILIFLTMVLDLATGLAEIEVANTQSGIEFLQLLAQSPFVTLLSPLLELMAPLQMVAVFLALLYGFFRVGPDFERVQRRQIAQVEKGLRDASTFYATGKMYAKEGMWASAVLHYRRAAAHEPNRPYFHIVTGQAYARLGFYRRAMDAYTSARRLATDKKVIVEIESMIAAVEPNLANP
jgi:tetratricopeptide (TPR) repeat protein